MWGANTDTEAEDLYSANNELCVGDQIQSGWNFGWKRVPAIGKCLSACLS